ncbi:MAG: tRNA (adenosine(37)-N6)-threonylcarbamoyltransferase complex ATPase subunit type 1 TsaE, partial [Acidimicrobiales bacterium]
AATRDVAARLSRCCRSGDVILLAGDLGAGKTAFAQGFAAALGVTGPVTSPTFTLVRHYRCGGDSPVAHLIHADVYRTGSLGEVVELALTELVEEGAVALVEWGDRAAPALGDDVLEVALARPGPAAGSDEERTIVITGRGAWTGRADEVARALAGRTGTAA